MFGTVVFFTDLETDDAIALHAIKPHCDQLLVVAGGSDKVGQKVTFLENLDFNVLPGYGTEAKYPDLNVEAKPYPFESLEEQNQTIEDACCAADFVFCTQPPGELLSLSEKGVKFNGTTLVFTGSYNLRMCWRKYTKDETIQRLQNLFPQQVVWIESYTAIGEENSLQEIHFKTEGIERIQKAYNNFLRERVDSELRERCRSIVDLNPREVTSLSRTLKKFEQIVHNPYQCLIVDVLAVTIMLNPDEYLSPVTFEGYGDTGYPVFKNAEKSNLFIAQRNQDQLKAATFELVLKF